MTHFYGNNALISLCKEMGVYCSIFKRDVSCPRCNDILHRVKEGESPR